MEEWQDQALVLSARAHGEGGAVVSVLTENHGRHAGYVRGAKSSRMRGIVEPGNLVGVRWSARVADSLGSFVLEQEHNITAGLMADPVKLGAVQSACALCDEALPEREVHPGLFYGLQALFDTMDTDIWDAAYVMWEIAFLKELGFGLNLTRCAGGGDANDLCFVSPKSGHAVSRAAGAPYKEKLLVLPGFLRPEKEEVTLESVYEGLQMTGHFMEHWVFNHHTKGVPPARLQFQDRFGRSLAASTVENDAIA